MTKQQSPKTKLNYFKKMKKRNLFTLGLASALLLFTTSCSDDDEDDDPVGPRLDVVEVTTGSDGGEVNVVQGDVVSFEWDARRGETDLETFNVTTVGVNSPSPIPTSNEGYTFPYTISNSEDELYVDGIVFPNGSENAGSTTYTFEVVDGIGQSATRTFTVNVTTSDENLSSPSDFTWTRIGSAPATGLAQFGLEWTTNSSTSAIVATDGDTEMYLLPESAWDFTMQSELATAIDAAASIDQYTNVSATESGTYNDVLGVVYDGVMYMLNIQQGEVTTTGPGTTIVIEGQYKN